MNELFLDFFRHFSAFNQNRPILLTVSGGIDSVVLAQLFHNNDVPFAIAHCNFGLRAAESDDDEQFVEKMASEFNVPFHCNKFDTSNFASNHGISIQMAARELRYKWFEEIRAAFDYSFIATAHHKNDVIETVLLNLTRGTGIAGLQGISAQSGNIIRPMLYTNRAEIAAYAAENELVWREDSSNESDKYARNLIRHKVIPVLKQLNSNLENTFTNNIKRISESSYYFNLAMEAAIKNEKRVENDNILYSKSFLKNQNAAFIYELIKEFDFNYLDANTLLEILDGQSGKKLISKSHILYVDRSDIIISTIQNNITSQFVDSETKSIQIHNKSIQFDIQEVTKNIAIEISNKPINEEWIDAESIYFPLIIRVWEPGDTFIPLGMNGTKKVSDFLIDEKVPMSEKSKVSVLISNEQIVALLGYRVDNRFKITSTTKKILKIIISDTNII